MWKANAMGCVLGASWGALLVGACATSEAPDPPQSGALGPSTTPQGSIIGEGGTSECVSCAHDGGVFEAATSEDAFAFDATTRPHDAGSASDAIVGNITVMPDGGGCPSMTVWFDWETHDFGRCHVQLPEGGTTSAWLMTDENDPYLGGIYANCVDGGWTISAEKCAPRGTGDHCFSSGTPCTGGGPAVFPYEHCWTCCNAPSIPIGPTCP